MTDRKELVERLRADNETRGEIMAALRGVEDRLAARGDIQSDADAHTVSIAISAIAALTAAQAGAVTEEPGTIERHDFGSKAGDPDWCYSCGEHRSHPAHAESQRPYPFTLLDLDIARIIDPSSFLPGADEQDQNLAIAKAKRIAEALTAALGAQTPPEGAVRYYQCGWRIHGAELARFYEIEQEAEARKAAASFGGIVKPVFETLPTPPVNQSEGADRG